MNPLLYVPIGIVRILFVCSPLYLLARAGGWKGWQDGPGGDDFAWLIASTCVSIVEIPVFLDSIL